MSAGGEIVLDLSRLLSRADRSTPTGIDRVELAYARHLLEVEGPRLRFAAITGIGRIHALPRAGAQRFLDAMEAVWANGPPARGPDLRSLAGMLSLHALRDGGAGLPQARRGGPRPTYLLVSHHHLDRPAAIRRAVQSMGARFVSLVHDVIPVEFPEYQRPGFDERHAVRMDTVASQSDAVIVNSDATGRALAPFLAAAGRSPPVISAALGLHREATAGAPARASAGPGDFACISTIEPRKNHLLLVNIWRRLVATLGPATPHLHVVGHRGWHNAAVFDVLDRSTALKPFVTEHSALDDAGVAKLLARARAVLMPSFAEGYGLPVVEALAAGVPVICSDLGAFREVGGDAPEYLDPLDGLAWLAAVKDYSDPASPRRTAQLARIERWTPPTWTEHFAKVDPVLRDSG